MEYLVDSIVLDSLRIGSAVKVRWLIVTGVFQIIAIALLGLSVVSLLGVFSNLFPDPAGRCNLNIWWGVCE
jgi:hypothetical protein